MNIPHHSHICHQVLLQFCYPIKSTHLSRQPYHLGIPPDTDTSGKTLPLIMNTGHATSNRLIRITCKVPMSLGDILLWLLQIEAFFAMHIWDWHELLSLFVRADGLVSGSVRGFFIQIWMKWDAREGRCSGSDSAPWYILVQFHFLWNIHPLCPSAIMTSTSLTQVNLKFQFPHFLSYISSHCCFPHWKSLSESCLP